jgi:AcrR family transcriptional regulator
MGISSRKEREKKELRAKIIDATAKILIDQGYEKTTIRKVAEAIEYSPRTVYLYFKDKDSLLMEIIEEGFAGTLEKRSRLKETLDYSNRTLLSKSL